MTTGQFLKEQRLRLGLSMRAIGRIIGKDHSYLSLIESGAMSPTVETLAQICPGYQLEVWEAAAGMTRSELARQILGPVPLDDPAVKQMLLLAARPDGPAQIREMLALAQSDPGMLRQALVMVGELRKQGLLKE